MLPEKRQLYIEFRLVYIIVGEPYILPKKSENY